MHHPFDRIIPAHANPAHATRRTALGWMLAAPPALAAALQGFAAEDDNQPGRALYFVVPHDPREFTLDRQRELNVQGDFQYGWKAIRQLKRRPGFLAWLTADQATVVAGAEDVAVVAPIDSRHKILPAVRPQGAARLTISLHPNSWKNKPDSDTYLTRFELAEIWNAAARKAEAPVKFEGVRAGWSVTATLEDADDEKGVAAVVEIASQHPQVGEIAWAQVDTTAALNEEGGAPQPTTLAIGEEGGPKPSTRALGEEGGFRPTTKALGEEGGPKPSTRALGEEGGLRPTTKALGEEGGPTTRAVGEEGGKPPQPQPTTLALGEEG